MTNNECAKLLIEMHADYFSLLERHGKTIATEYSEAVAMAIMALTVRRSEDEK